MSMLKNAGVKALSPYILLTVHLGTVLVNNQLDALLT
jgi:hypothetical protein